MNSVYMSMYCVKDWDGSLCYSIALGHADGRLRFCQKERLSESTGDFSIEVLPLKASISLTISPKSGPFRGMFWVGRFSTFGSKTHFPEN